MRKLIKEYNVRVHPWAYRDDINNDPRKDYHKFFHGPDNWKLDGVFVEYIYSTLLFFEREALTLEEIEEKKLEGERLRQ